MNTSCRRQRGSALIAALFLIVVVAALGAFAMHLNAMQNQTATLQLLQARAAAAAHAGLEFWSQRVYSDPGNNLPCAATNVPISGFPGFDGFTVTVDCIRIANGSSFVYEVTATAVHGAFGDPSFVRRQATRRLTNIGAQSW
jgi:MSHA biogenesis protein MshP